MTIQYLQDFAEIYDYVQTPLLEEFEDINFYAEFAKKLGGEILSLGCGTGRIEIQLAKQGFKVTCIDNSSYMLKILQKKYDKIKNSIKGKIKILLDQMTSFQLDKKFKFIFIAGNTFAFAETQEDQLKILELIKQHLHKNGVAVIANYQSECVSDNTYLFRRIYDYKDGLKLLEHRMVHIDLNKQSRILHLMFDYLEEEKIVKKKHFVFNTKIIFHREMLLLCRIAGLRVNNIYGDYKKLPLTQNSKWWIYELSI